MQLEILLRVKIERTQKKERPAPPPKSSKAQSAPKSEINITLNN